MKDNIVITGEGIICAILFERETIRYWHNEISELYPQGIACRRGAYVE